MREREGGVLCVNERDKETLQTGRWHSFLSHTKVVVAPET
jgi:hypothetical protein